MGSVVESCRRQHRQILELATELEQVLKKPGEVASHGGDVRKLISKMSGLVKVHLANEDKVLYPRLVSSKQAKVSSTAKEFTTSMGGLVNTYVAWDAKWTAQLIAQKPNDFVHESRTIIDALGSRVSHEERDLYRLAESEGL
jgi:hypothetical protein